MELNTMSVHALSERVENLEQQLAAAEAKKQEAFEHANRHLREKMRAQEELERVRSAVEEQVVPVRRWGIAPGCTPVMQAEGDWVTYDEYLIVDTAYKYWKALASPAAKPSAGVVHKLKTDPEVFRATAAGLKTFEIRFDDRGYKVGDLLMLCETESTAEEMKSGAPLIFTGNALTVRIAYILRGPQYGLADDWVILAHAQARPAPATELNGTISALIECCRKICFPMVSAESHKVVKELQAALNRLDQPAPVAQAEQSQEGGQ